MSEKKPKALRMVSIKVIETRGESSLVEWIEKRITQRGYVANGDLDGNKAPVDILTYSLRYGLDPMTIDLAKLTKQLRLRDVWTQADFQKKSHAVIRSLLEAMEVK